MNINIENISITYNNTVFWSYAGMLDSIACDIEHSDYGMKVYSVLNGELTVYIKDEAIHLEANDTLFISPRTDYYTSFYRKEDDGILNISLIIYKNNLSAYCDLFGHFRDNILLKKYFLFKSTMPITNAIRDIIIRGSSDVRSEICALVFEVDRIWCDRSAAKPCHSDFSGREIIDTIDAIINNYFTLDISLSELASMFFISERQLERIIAAEYNCVFHDLLHKRRMEYAAKMLVKSDYSISAIASSVCFKSYNGFFSAFRRFYGASPQEYRDSNR